MIEYECSFSQMSVAETLRHAQNERVREQIVVWAGGTNFYPSEKNDKGDWIVEIEPEKSILVKTVLRVFKSDACKETGIAKEISFVRYHRPCCKFGLPEGDWIIGAGFVRNGILFNHGTIEKPSWSVHT